MEGKEKEGRTKKERKKRKMRSKKKEGKKGGRKSQERKKGPSVKMDQGQKIVIVFNDNLPCGRHAYGPFPDLDTANMWIHYSIVFENEKPDKNPAFIFRLIATKVLIQDFF